MKINLIPSVSQTIQQVNTFNTKDLLVYLHGDILGQLTSSGQIIKSSAETIQSIIDHINSDKIFDFEFDLTVGSYTLVIFNTKIARLDLFTSTTGVSPYILKDNDVINICFDENKLISSQKAQLSSEVLCMISNSHQLVSRYPLSLYGIDSTLRNPSGHYLSLNISNNKYSIDPLIKISLPLCLEQLEITLKSIIKLYCSYYQGNIGLLFSGGLDSSCLAALLNHQSLDIPFYHIDYKGSVSKRSRVAFYIAQKLGFQSLHIPKSAPDTDPDKVINSLTESFLSLPNSMYLSQPILRGKYGLPKYMITGQGADSIYVLDSFAPPTELIGNSRVRHIIDTSPKRNALSEASILKYLKMQNKSRDLAHIAASDEFFGFVDAQSTSTTEHVDYSLDVKSNKPKWYVLRNKYITNPIYNLIQSFKFAQGQSISSLYRYVKWMRSLTNVPSNYSNSFSSQGIQRLTPFLEAPVVRLFYNYKIRDIESLQIKDLLERLFSRLSFYSHRELVEDALSGEIITESMCGTKLDTLPDESSISTVRKKIIQLMTIKFKESDRFSDLKKDINNVDQLMRIMPWL